MKPAEVDFVERDFPKDDVEMSDESYEPTYPMNGARKLVDATSSESEGSLEIQEPVVPFR